MPLATAVDQPYKTPLTGLFTQQAGGIKDMYGVAHYNWSPSYETKASNQTEQAGESAGGILDIFGVVHYNWSPSYEAKTCNHTAHCVNSTRPAVQIQSATGVGVGAQSVSSASCPVVAGGAVRRSRFSKENQTSAAQHSKQMSRVASHSLLPSSTNCFCFSVSQGKPRT